MKSLFLISIITICACLNITAQNDCNAIAMFKDGERALELKNYRAVILKLQAAAKCDPSLANKTNNKILFAFDKIQELSRRVERDKLIAEQNLENITTLINDITELLQRHENAAIIGLEPLQNEIFKVILPYHDIISKESSDTNNHWKVAKSYLQIGLSMQSMGEAGFEKQLKKAYEVSLSFAQKFKEKKIKIPEDLIVTLLKSSVYLSWDLMNKNYIDQTEIVLLEANHIIEKTENSSEAVLYSKASFNNALSRFYGEKEDYELAYTYKHKVISDIKKAIKLNPNNLLYKSSLAIYLRNLNSKHTSSLLNEGDKKLVEEGCEIASEVYKSNGSGTLGLTTLALCTYDKTYELVKKNQHNEAIKLLIKSINDLSLHIKLNSQNPSLYLHRSRLYTRLSKIYGYQNKTEEEFEMLFKAKEDWVIAINNKTSLPQELWIVRDVYDHVRRLDVLEKEPQKKTEILKDIERAIRATASKHQNVFEIADIAADANLYLGRQLYKQNKEYDTALSCFNKSIDYFYKTNTLANEKFSDIYSKFCYAYSDRLKLNLKHEKLDLALEDIQQISEIFTPILKKFPYDFYLRYSIIRSNELLGDALFKQKRYEEALPLLELASKWGKKESSMQLSHIYKDSIAGFLDLKKSDDFKQLSSRQSTRTFKINYNINDDQYERKVYVYDYPEEFEYKGIDDQVEYLKYVNGGIVPEKTRNIFKKLQKSAWNKKESFPEYCHKNKGLFEIEKNLIDTTITKEITENKTLNKQQKMIKFENMLSNYRKKYETNSNESTLNNIFKIGYKYISFLNGHSEFQRSKRIVNMLIKLNPEKGTLYRKMAQIELAEYDEMIKQNPNFDFKIVLISSSKLEGEGELEALGEYYRHFIRKGEKKIALYWMEMILKRLKYNSSIKFILFKSQVKQNFFLFEELYLLNEIPALKKDIAIFQNETIEEKDYKKKKAYYKYLILLEEYLLKKEASDDLKKTIASHYNSLAWYQILTKEFKLSKKTIDAGLKIDSQNLYLHTNLPAALMLMGKHKKALNYYSEWKEKSFNVDDRFETFKDAFLDDIKTFKDRKIIPEKLEKDVESIIKLLKT